MSRYKRVYGGTAYFFTVVTYERRPFLCDNECRDALRESITETRQSHPFNIDAWVLLPDHIHCIWTLPDENTDYSKIWGLIKSRFSKKTKGVVQEDPVRLSDSRLERRERGVWQRRFWEHLIRDQRDYNAHMDYVHYNPVKHGLASAPRDWKYSSFHRFVDEGVYDIEWGESVDLRFTVQGDT